MGKIVEADDVSFNPEIIAAAWEAFDDGIPAVCAAALVNELPNGIAVTANEGEEADRDVIFSDVSVMVEEKAMGVCDESVAEEYAPAYIKLDRDDGRVLALNAGQVYENHIVPEA